MAKLPACIVAYEHVVFCPLHLLSNPNMQVMNMILPLEFDVHIFHVYETCECITRALIRHKLVLRHF